MGSPRREARPSKNPAMAVLLRAAQEDRELRSLFEQLAALPQARRNNLLARLTEDAEKRGAPEDFRRALAELHDPEILQKLQQLL